jgi:MinD superfamily P-loop ATPase
MRVTNSWHTVVTPRIDYEHCRACGTCLAAKGCRFKAIVRIDRDEPPAIDASRCGGCAACVASCPFGAVLPPL